MGCWHQICDKRQIYMVERPIRKNNFLIFLTLCLSSKSLFRGSLILNLPATRWQYPIPDIESCFIFDPVACCAVIALNSKGNWPTGLSSSPTKRNNYKIFFHLTYPFTVLWVAVLTKTIQHHVTSSYCQILRLDVTTDQSLIPVDRFQRERH